MRELLERIEQHKLDEQSKFGYYIDIGGEIFIYEDAPEDPKYLYEGNVHGFISELMKELNVRDDN